MPKITFRYPGLWRACEVCAEIKKRLGCPMPYSRFQYLLRVGVIPWGSEKVNIMALWTDQEVEGIIATLANCLNDVQLGV